MRLPWGYELAIDLGTANTHLFVKGAGVVVREPSVVAFDASGRRPVAVGLEARRMLERDVEGVRVVRPIRSGVVADFDAAVIMLRMFLQEAIGKRPLFSPLVVTSHPHEATRVEHRALVDAIHGAGGGQIVSVSRGLANALGAGLPVNGDVSQLVIDLGAGVTNVAVVAMGLATSGISIRFGGNDLDEVIRRGVKRSQSLAISPATAEQAKLRVGTLYTSDEDEVLRVDSQATNGDTSVSADVLLSEIPEMLRWGFGRIIPEILWFLEELAPRQQSEIAANGAILTGGGALCNGVDALLAEKLGIPVRVATDPMSCTVLGLEAVLNDPQGVSMGGRRFRLSGA